jgi:hypothetical protein
MGNYNTIIAGFNNKIGAGCNYCSIINGDSNTIPASRSNVHIIGNGVSADTTKNNIFYVGCTNGLHCDGDVVAYSSSDERLKDNITPLSGCLNKVLSLDAIEFDWNDNQQTYSGHDIGLIAQQVQEIAPEIVTQRKDGFLAMKYEKVIPLLVGATQEQDAQINELEKQLQELIEKSNH